jgi:Spy/CpxP family protein refolding chaperone
MKLTKTITLATLVAAGLLAGTALQAQDAPKDKPAAAPGGGPAMRGPNMDQLAKELNLNEEQKTKIKAAQEERVQKAREVRQDTNLSQEDRKAKMKEIQETFTAKIKEILTPDQFEKWQKHAQQRRQVGPGADKPAGEKPSKKD